MINISVSDKEINQRLDKYLLKYFNQAPKSFIYKMLRKKNIKYNGNKADGNEILQSGDILQIFLSDDTISKFKEDITIHPAERKFNIIFEDSNVLFVSKPAGVLSHPEKDGDNNTLIQQVHFYLTENGEYDPNLHRGFKPALCNRLDRNTSGIIGIGKNIIALQELNNANKNELIDKIYLALVCGKVTKAGTLIGYHVKDTSSNEVVISKNKKTQGKKVITKYSPIKSTNEYSMLEVELVTGKSHQIRAHLKEMGNPVVGDKKYGNEAANMVFKKNYGLNNQFLHAYKFIYKNNEGPLSYLFNKELVAPLPKNLSIIEKKLFN